MKFTLENFRNYRKADLQWTSGETLLIHGQNGQGKSNLLEAVGILVWGRSWRTQKLREVIMWGENHARITSEWDREKIEFAISRMPEKKLFKNNDQSVLASEFVGQLNAVLFTPEDLNLIYGEPQDRRRFLDRLLIQSDSSYLEALTQFGKVLKQRNELLRKLNSRPDREWELEIWDMKLVEFAEEIWKKRQALVAELSQNLSEDYSDLAGRKQKIKLHYATPPVDYSAELVARRREDLRQNHTTLGPHRDDWNLLIDREPAVSFASRGECRSLVLALKLAELVTLKNRGRTPMLLLDDVFSELDADRSRKLLNAIAGQSTLITSTEKIEGDWRTLEVNSISKNGNLVI